MGQGSKSFPSRGSCRAATDEVLSRPSTSSALRAPSPQGEGGSHAAQRRQQSLRVLVGVGAPALLLALCLTLLRGGHLFCLFHELTGLYCPGCGSGRAALALLHGRVGEAFGHNALAMLFLPPCAYFLLREYLRFVFPGLGLRPTALPAWAGWASAIPILAFWVLRNLPAFAFLAP